MNGKITFFYLRLVRDTSPTTELTKAVKYLTQINSWSGLKYDSHNSTKSSHLQSVPFKQLQNKLKPPTYAITRFLVIIPHKNTGGHCYPPYRYRLAIARFYDSYYNSFVKKSLQNLKQPEPCRKASIKKVIEITKISMTCKFVAHPEGLFNSHHWRDGPLFPA